MEIIIGREGNQKIAIDERSVSRRHCKLTIDENGKISLEDIGSKFGTFLNGKSVTSANVKLTDTLGLGPRFSVKVGELIDEAMIKAAKKPKNHEPRREPETAYILPEKDILLTFTNYSKVLQNCKRQKDLEEMLTAVEAQKPSLPPFVAQSIKAAIACKLIRAGKLSKAQTLLYDAGDKAYKAQDGSSEMEGCYASILTLIATLYSSAYKYEDAEKAVAAAVGILNRWVPGELFIYVSLVADAYNVLGDVLSLNKKKDVSKQCYEHAIELYRQSGPADPVLFSAKISELEKKISSK